VVERSLQRLARRAAVAELELQHGDPRGEWHPRLRQPVDGREGFPDLVEHVLSAGSLAALERRAEECGLELDADLRRQRRTAEPDDARAAAAQRLVQVAAPEPFDAGREQ